jgi:MoaA/NifB/PqqE/SkfB family radical SAM enzyme
MCAVRRHADPATELDLSGWQQAARVLADTGLASVVLTGGEPYLRPDFPEIVRAFAARGLSVKVQTGGGPSVTPDRLRDTVRAGATDFQFSLDSLSRERQERIWGVTGHYDRVVANLRAAKAIVGTGTVVISTVISHENLDELPGLVRFARDAGAVFFAAPVQLAGRRAPHELFRGYCPPLALTDGDRKRVRGVIRSLVRMKRRGLPVGSSTRYLWDTCRYLETGEARWACGAGALYVHVRPDGSVAACSETPAISPDAEAFRADYASGRFRRRALATRARCAGCLQSCWREAAYAVRNPAALLENVRTYLAARRPPPA